MIQSENPAVAGVEGLQSAVNSSTISTQMPEGAAEKDRIDGKGVSGERPAPIQCGDHVLHRPSGETWLVAAADHANNDLMWCGWPEGIARISDCEVIKRAAPEQSRALHLMLTGARRRMADRVYGDPLASHLEPKP